MVKSSSVVVGVMGNMAHVRNEHFAFTLQNMNMDMEENGDGEMLKQYFRFILMRIVCEVLSLLPMTMTKLDMFLRGEN